MSKRTDTEALLYTWVKKITKSDMNVNLYKKHLSNMSDKEFTEFMTKLKNKEIKLQVIVPPDMGDTKITVENNIKLAKEIGQELYQRLIITDNDAGTKRMSKNKFLILDLPLRRMKQTSEKGVSVATDNKHVDVLTGQVKGDSAASKLTYPELQILSGLGMTNSLVELMKDRGGDIGANNTLINGLIQNGTISQKLVEQYSTGVESTKILKSYLNGMHIQSTL